MIDTLIRSTFKTTLNAPAFWANWIRPTLWPLQQTWPKPATSQITTIFTTNTSIILLLLLLLLLLLFSPSFRFGKTFPPRRWPVLLICWSCCCCFYVAFPFSFLISPPLTVLLFLVLFFFCFLVFIVVLSFLFCNFYCQRSLSFCFLFLFLCYWCPSLLINLSNFSASTTTTTWIFSVPRKIKVINIKAVMFALQPFYGFSFLFLRKLCKGFFCFSFNRFNYVFLNNIIQLFSICFANFPNLSFWIFSCLFYFFLFFRTCFEFCLQ